MAVNSQLIRVGLLSQDCALQPLLSSGLGNEFEVFLESNPDGIQHLIKNADCTVAIVDLNSIERGLKAHLETARRLISGDIPVIVLADDVLRVAANDLVRDGAFAYCRRPPSLRDLRVTVRNANEKVMRRREFSAEKRRLDELTERNQMVGSSPAMALVHDLIDRVAGIDASVLVCGESGTGKELIARAIHSIGSRARRPFVTVACGAIPETLIESELFGHEKGAFTGTVGSREGFFEQAADGTLFLDEIGELTPYTQVKLLRVLQQREFSRLGSSRLLPLRARLIFATHRDLAEMVAQAKFRQDLFYRINVMKIDAPTLQDRAEDIPQIAIHFLRHYSTLFQKPVDNIEPCALSLLQEYPWPGNVRELENVIQRAIILAPGKVLRADDLPRNLREELVANEADCVPGGSFECQLRDYKIKLAENALREHNGNKTLAARSLSISRGYLHRLIRLAESGSVYEPADVESAEIS
ncbi:MAG TPA: sigma-54 dependent transcriptional regulator [Terracidiphilus sp.]|jgi:DNA-binding NtrC family response regulator|nr:sigma-54 dependent transcriptional regulator [Terracidiphilus sp.]